MNSNANSIKSYLQNVSNNMLALQNLAQTIDSAAQTITQSLKQGGTIFFCGNGGSAADSQHLAAELIGRYKNERQALAAIALTVDTSAITAIANDYGYQHIFTRQLSGLGKKNDVLIALSTSGNSPNIIDAINLAKQKNIKTIGMTGQSSGKMTNLCDIIINAPATETNHIQEMHITIGHILCGITELAITQNKNP